MEMFINTINTALQNTLITKFLSWLLGQQLGYSLLSSHAPR